MVEKRLSQEEAEEFLRLYEKLSNEMLERLETGEIEETTYTTLLRNKYKKYIRDVYGVNI